MFKKRKLISIMLTISMMLTLFPFAAFAEEAGAPVAAPEQAQEAPAQPAASSAKVAEVNGTQYDTLSAAIEAVQADGTVTLKQNVQINSSITLSKSFTLDLGGNTLSLKKGEKDTAIFIGENVKLTLKNGKITSDASANTACLILKNNATLDAKEVAINATCAGILTTANVGNATINFNGSIDSQDVGIWLQGPKNNLTVDGATINSKYFGVYQNGSAGGSVITLKNSTIVDTLDGGAGVYVSNNKTNSNDQKQGFQTLNIENCKITGATGVEVKYTNVTIDDKSTLTATGQATSTTPDSNGSTTSGFALAITHNGKDASKDSAAGTVEIKGGTFNGYVGVQEPSADQTTAAQVTISGGNFTNDVSEFIPEGSFQDENGVVNALNETTAAAKIGDVLYGTLDKAIEAANNAENGATVDVLRDASIKDAKFVINKNVVLKSAKAAKIDVTVASGETTKAFEVKQGAGLTLDGVTMTINGTKNADTAKKNDGTGIDIYNSTNQDVAGAILTLKNGAVLNLTNLERATIASSTPASAKVVNQSIVTLEPGTTMNITNIDGNGANGGDWIVDGATLNVDGCGSYGVSAQTVTAKNNANVNVKNVGISGVTAKDIAIENGSQVNVTQSGTKLPFTDWKGNQVNDVVTLKDQGSLTLDKDSKLALTDNKVNTFGPGNGTVGMAGQFIGEMNAPAPDAAKNEVRITYTVNGDVYKSFVATKSGDTVTFTEPSAPSVAGYTFKGWNYGKAVVQVADGQVTLTPATETTFIFTADLVANAAPSPSYQVDVATADNGSVTVTPQRASAGKTVTITATPDKGYVVDVVTVTDKDGKSVEVVKKADGTYTFTMPKGAVTVKVSFKAEATAPNALPFTDVHESDWFYGPVVYAYEHGIMNGTGDGTTFSPNVPLNRAMIAAVLYNLEGGPAVDNDGAFSDVPSGQWYTDAVNWAASEGIVGGIGDGLYAPNANLTREQMASVLYRYAQYKGIDVSKRADLATFVDGTTVSPWATEVVEWAVAEKLINGTAGNTLQPQGTATRAQVATVLMNFCENVAK